MEINVKIRKLREEKGFSQSYVANELGISKSTYSKIELNKSQISWRKVNLIAKLYSMSVLDLANIQEECAIDKENLAKNINLVENLILQYESKIEALETEVKTLKEIQE